jgi:NADP-dependent 3-hydroxy acid dehydrogenase YdfG
MARFAANPERRPAVITGASSGIGRATARLLASKGHPIVVGARRLEELEQLVGEIVAESGEATALRLDLKDPASIEAFAQGAVEALGEVEVIVSNAGVNLPGPVLGLDPEDLADVMKVNVEGTHLLLRALLPGLVERRRGDVVIVTSDVAARPRPSMAAYVTSKWGLEGYVRALQMELEGTGVRATLLRPGPTMTQMGFDWDPEVTGKVIEEWVRWGFGRHDGMMKPEHVAAALAGVLELPRGIHVSTIELQPEAPLVDGGASK